MLPTPFAELNAVLKEMVEGIRRILAGNFIGAYLQGSFAVGDFDRDSDVDFIVAMNEELSDVQVEALQALHKRIYHLDSEWAKHLEGSYYPKQILRDYSHSGKPLWYLDHGSQSLVRSDHCNTVVVRWVVRDHGVSLAGPAPLTLVESIPVNVLRREIVDTITGWGQQILAGPERYSNRFYQGFIVLNYCRMLHDLHVGCPGSKRAGAEWAKSTLESGWNDLIDRAWACRPNPALSVRTPADPKDFELTLEFVQNVIKLSQGYAGDLTRDQQIR